MKYLLAIFLLLIPSFVFADSVVISDPSDEATHWRVELQDGTVYEGEVDEGRLYWEIGHLDPGTYEGNAYFIAPEWELTAEGETTESGEVMSEPTPFELVRQAVGVPPEGLGFLIDKE